MQLNLGLPVLLALDTQQQLAPAALKFSLAAAATIAISKNSLNSCFCVSSAPNWKSGQQSLGHMLFLAAKKARKASTSLFSYPLLHNTGEGNGNPLQYSCLENPWTEEPGGYTPCGHRELDTTEWLTFSFSWNLSLLKNFKSLYCLSLSTEF